MKRSISYLLIAAMCFSTFTAFAADGTAAGVQQMPAAQVQSAQPPVETPDLSTEQAADTVDTLGPGEQPPADSTPEPDGTASDTTADVQTPPEQEPAADTSVPAEPQEQPEPAETPEPAEDAAEPMVLSEDETYMLNIVLFAMEAGRTADEIAGEFDALGIRRAEPLFTDDAGNAKGLGEKQEVWYRAYTDRDVQEVIASITELDGVVYAEPEYVYQADDYGEPEEVDSVRDWVYAKLLRLNDAFWWATELFHGFAPGQGTVVAVIDTGVDYTHEDLASNMWVNTAELYGTPGVDDDNNGYMDDIYGADVTATGTKAGNPMDDHGHGTHVAGIIGMSANGRGSVGLAYGTKIMAIKAGQSTGTLASSHIAKAVNYAHMMGADVINMSFGGTGKSYLVETALEDAFSDCVLVASAGNNGRPTTDAVPYMPNVEDVYPAGYSYVIGVMATDQLGRLAGFSNWDYQSNANAEYEITAPGVDIYSTLPGNRYAMWSGTSMAAPFVSAAAAILRSHYDDKDTYSSRFIAGQLVSATRDRARHTAPKGESYSYPALNVYDSIKHLPKPNITVKETFLLDNVGSGDVNDGDAIIDAGETVDMGVRVRNQWGQTGEITVHADAVSEGGVPNPWITFETDTVTLQPAGTFAEVDNGFVYDDSLLTAVDNPIRFTVSPKTPNDTEICINLTVTTTNGFDDSDRGTYTSEDTYTFRVQAGRGIRGTLTEDTTLTSDYLWIVENSLLIPEGVTLTIEPGTKIQFYSSDYEGAYGGLTIPRINNEGTLNAIGTADQPIEMYPGAGFESYAVEISGAGMETLKYCNIINPRLGYTEYLDKKPLDVVDHCTLTQNPDLQRYRYIHNGIVTTNTSYASWYHIGSISNSQLTGIRYIYSPTTVQTVEFHANSIENCLFNNCCIYAQNESAYGSYGVEQKNNTYLSGEIYTISKGFNKPSFIGKWTNIKKPVLQIGDTVYTYDGAASKYITVNFFDNVSGSTQRYHDLQEAANTLGGTIACINDTEEETYIKNFVKNEINKTVYIGYRYNPDTGKGAWDDGSNYEISLSSSGQLSATYPFTKLSPSGSYAANIAASDYLLEIPADIPDTEITQTLFDVLEQLAAENNTQYCNTITNNAILNPVLNNDPNSWTILVANEYNKDNIDNYAYNNYWGTENKTLIDRMITDGDDFPGTYQNIVEDPILTLESESLQDIYPFVTQVYLTDSDGHITAQAEPGETYTVHVKFNRDMDTGVQPSVTYGPAAPYTDYTVDGDFVSPREWTGEVRISPVLTSGTMYWRTKGGCAADDQWLECGEDVLRFSFNVSTSGVLAMLLNAAGGANKVELSWAQNDYETLAGYNIYRSEQPDEGFEKINLSIVTGTTYTDTDVEPGVTYYYYFKVVNTDGNEEASTSNTASATPIDNIFPVLRHAPVTTAKMGSQITISATATDNIGVADVTLYYRTAGQDDYRSKTMTAGENNRYVAVIPADAVTAEGVEYYVTAADADGNVSYSGTAQLPNVIAVDSKPYISGITPSKISTEGGQTITILGGNFTEDMTLKVGGREIAEKSVPDAGQIQFIAPANASGSYAVTLTDADGQVTISPTPLSYTDASSIAQIPTTMEMVSGLPYTIPLYISANGDILSLHAELNLPAADFTQVTVEKADGEANFQLEYSYSGGVLQIGCIGTGHIGTPDQPIVNILVTPKATEDKQYEIKLHDVRFNDVEVQTIISGQVHIKPSYLINALVQYFSGEDNMVEGVTITAAGVSGITGPDGRAELTVSDRDVTITAAKLTPDYAITAYDASLVLQSAVGKTELTDHQKLAADVNGDGRIGEYDAALILQMAVKKIDAFPIGKTWIFSPSSIDKTLGTAATPVTFTAISIGDVDGSYRGNEE